MGNKFGFTLIETLFSLMIASVVLTLCLSGLKILRQIKPLTPVKTDKEIMFKQLQNELILATDITTDHQELRYYKENQWFVLCLDRNRLVKKEGYEIFLYEVDQIEFEIKDFIYLTLYQNNQIDKRIIGVYRDEI